MSQLPLESPRFSFSGDDCRDRAVRFTRGQRDQPNSCLVAAAERHRGHEEARMSDHVGHGEEEAQRPSRTAESPQAPGVPERQRGAPVPEEPGGLAPARRLVRVRCQTYRVESLSLAFGKHSAPSSSRQSRRTATSSSCQQASPAMRHPPPRRARSAVLPSAGSQLRLERSGELSQGHGRREELARP